MCAPCQLILQLLEFQELECGGLSLHSIVQGTC